jgi:hypothetical protein
MGVIKHYQMEIESAAWVAHRKFKAVYGDMPNLQGDCYCKNGACQCDLGEKDRSEILRFGQEAMQAYGWGAVEDQGDALKADLMGAIKDATHSEDYDDLHPSFWPDGTRFEARD